MKIFISENGRQPSPKRGTGVVLEDVNCAIDGGLCAELLENPAFEGREVRAENGRCVVLPPDGYAWAPFPDAAAAAMKVKTDRPLHAENPHYLRVVAAEDGAGICNRAFGGVSLKRGTEYRISFFLRSYDYRGAAYAGLYGENAAIEGKVKVKPDGKWRRYSFKCKSKADVSGAEFHFTLAKAGMVHADCFSVMPEDAILGYFRRDLASMLTELKPDVLYFPGAAAADSAENRFRWKDSVGEPLRRPYRWNVYALRGGDPHDGQTLRVGFFECFRLSEYLGATAVPVLGMGGSKDLEEDLEPYVQDALDLIEFANGGTDTMWGKIRAELGHPAAFGLKAIAVPTDDARAARFVRFAGEIRERDASVELVPFRAPAERASDPQADAWAHALGEAVRLTECGQGADLYPSPADAALFARLGRTQRLPALVSFDAAHAYASGQYHVQKLCRQSAGDFVLNASADDESVRVSASSREGFTFVRIVNSGGAEIAAEAEGDFDFGELTRVICMDAPLDAANTPETPDRIVPREIAPTAPRTAALPPHSFTVLVFRRQGKGNAK